MANPTTADPSTLAILLPPTIVHDSNFLRPPGEIRNMIYALVLTAPGRTIHHVSEGYLEYHAKSTVVPQANGSLENNPELMP